MDFIMGLPPSNSYIVILVVVDHLSKYSHLILLKADYNNYKVAEVFIHTIVKLHQYSMTIVFDRERVFTSQFWQHLFKFIGTMLAKSTAYHLLTDGQYEVVNKCLELYIRCFNSNCHCAWSKLLPLGRVLIQYFLSHKYCPDTTQSGLWTRSSESDLL